MFNTLLASDRKVKRGTMTPATLIVSAAFHGLLLVGAVYASVRPPEAPEKPAELVTYIDVAEPPEPAPPPPVEAAPAPPLSAPALVPPLDPPPFIPPPDATQPRINIDLYTGNIPTLTPPELAPPGSFRAIDSLPGERPDSGVYTIDALDSAPEITNRAAIEATMHRDYPKALANAGIEGEVIAQFVVLPDGTIDLSTVKIISASNERFEEATRGVLARFRFRPGRLRGAPVAVLTSVPVQWRVRR